MINYITPCVLSSICNISSIAQSAIIGSAMFILACCSWLLYGVQLVGYRHVDVRNISIHLISFKITLVQFHNNTACNTHNKDELLHAIIYYRVEDKTQAVT